MNQQRPERNLFTLWEAYRNVYLAVRTMPHLARARRSGAMPGPFKERLMLAVTEVNGCALCSYAHTKMALEAGLSPGEIRDMLAGENGGVPEEELPAILFVQHYADTRGRPSADAWGRMRALYGREKAMAILGAARDIMVGNAYGIPGGSLLGRMFGGKFRVDARSGFAYELLMLLSVPVVVPVAALQALVLSILRVPAEPEGGRG